MAEALVTILGMGRFRGYSAGSRPTGRINGFAIEQITNLAPSYPVDTLRSKSWDDFAVAGAPIMDIIVTVCDNAAGETCPYWPGQPATAHWGFEDPAAVDGTDEEKRAAFNRIFNQIKKRIDAFVALPIESMSMEQRRNVMQKIGEISE